MSKLYDLLNSVVAKLKATEKSVPKKVSDLEQDVKTSWDDLDGKPFYKETEWTSLWSLEIPGGWSMWTNKSGTVGSCIYYGHSNLYNSVFMKDGVESLPDSLQVILDGVSYECFLTKTKGDLETLAWYGNAKAGLLGDDYPDTGEPFCIAVTHTQFGNGARFYRKYDANLVSGELRTTNIEFLEGRVLSVLPIKPSYIPYGFGCDWRDIKNRPFYYDTQPIIEEQTVETTDGASSKFAGSAEMLIGYTYLVNFDNTEYILKMTGSYFGNTSLYTTSGTDNGLPFFIRYSYSSGSTYYYYLMSSIPGQHTISVSQVDIKQIDPKYIPDTIARTEDIPVVPEHTWESLPDKPTVVAGGDTLTWDGNTDGILCVSAELDGEMTPLFYKISDAVPTRQDFEKGIVAFSNEGNVVFGWQEEVDEEHMNAVFDMFFRPDGFFVYDWFYIVPTDNYVWEFDLTITFPESGIYVMNPEMVGGFIQSLTITDYTGFESEVLKESLIPDTIARKEDIPVVPDHTWESLPDKPFDETTTLGDTLTWDGNIDGKEKVMDMYYHVSSCVPTYEDFANGCTVSVHTNQSGEVEDVQISFEEIKELIDENYSEIGIVFTEYFFVIPHDNYEIMGMVIPNAGIYFLRLFEEYDDDYYVGVYTTSITINDYGKLSLTIVNPIADKYIPNTIARKSDIPEHTWESLPDKPFKVKYDWFSIINEDFTYDAWQLKADSRNPYLIYSSKDLGLDTQFAKEYYSYTGSDLPEYAKIRIEDSVHGRYEYEYPFVRINGTLVHFDSEDKVLGYYGPTSIFSQNVDHYSGDGPMCVVVCYNEELECDYYVLCVDAEYYREEIGSLNFILFKREIDTLKRLDKVFLPYEALTKDDLPTITQAVIEALPTAEGGSF